MSAATVRVAAKPSARPSARPSGHPAGKRSVSYLSLVATRRSSAARAPFVAVVVLILVAGLLGLLLLNTVLAQDAFRLHALQLQGRVLDDQQQSLERDVDRLQSPQSLAAQATALGMVPGGTRAFLRLSDGKVLGVALPGEAPPPVVRASPAAVAPVQPKPSAAANGGWVAVPVGRPAPRGKKPAARPSARP